MVMHYVLKQYEWYLHQETVLCYISEIAPYINFILFLVTNKI